MEKDKVEIMEEKKTTEGAEVMKESDDCKYCDNHPCLADDLKPMLVSIAETYSGIKTNRQLRFIMYGDATKSVHGTGLGKGVRKRLPSCVQSMIRSLAPDDQYTGFKEAKDMNKK